MQMSAKMKSAVHVPKKVVIPTILHLGVWTALKLSVLDRESQFFSFAIFCVT
jgi:hypothetical protein